MTKLEERLLSSLKWTLRSLKLMSESKPVKNLDECISDAEHSIKDTMKQIIKKEELVGKTIEKVQIPDSWHESLYLKFTDGSFAAFKVGQESKGFESYDYVTLDGWEEKKNSLSLLKLGVVTKKEFEEAQEEENKEDEKRHQEYENKRLREIEEYEKKQLNQLKEKYENKK